MVVVVDVTRVLGDTGAGGTPVVFTGARAAPSSGPAPTPTQNTPIATATAPSVALSAPNVLAYIVASLELDRSHGALPRTAIVRVAGCDPVANRSRPPGA